MDNKMEAPMSVLVPHLSKEFYAFKKNYLAEFKIVCQQGDKKCNFWNSSDSTEGHCCLKLFIIYSFVRDLI